MPDKNWQFELEEYIKQGEPERAEKSEAWQAAIGLQAVDGLKTSEYLLDTAKDHIEGKITIDEAQKRIHSYYEQRATHTETENETKEADIVSARITKLLGEKAFQFSPAEWLTIHRRLFEGVFDHAGKIRQYNISKKEWILNGETVIYADFNSIKDTLDYDFATEKQFSYEGLSVEASVKHLAKFASDIWQIHPFGEGNTRATAVFMIKYMKTFGFRVNNDAFRENSWYFRNALVRANYNDLQKGIHSTTKFLELFFSNLLLGTNYELKNRYIKSINKLFLPSSDDKKSLHIWTTHRYDMSIPATVAVSSKSIDASELDIQMPRPADWLMGIEYIPNHIIMTPKGKSEPVLRLDIDFIRTLNAIEEGYPINLLAPQYEQAAAMFLQQLDDNGLTEENDDGEVIIASRRKNYKKSVYIQDGQYGFEED